MRTSIIGGAFLLVGVGAATVAALEPGGNNIALNGSDTLFDVTQDVITQCKSTFNGSDGNPTFASYNITYKGGGSGAGSAQMQAGLQQITPMSRALKNTEYCSGSTSPASPGLTADLLVGIDGIAIVANPVTACDTNTSAPANGVGTLAAFEVTSDGTATGAPVPFVANNPLCPGCINDGAGNSAYQLHDSFDALKILYFGLTHSDANPANQGSYDCGLGASGGVVRKSLIRNWKNLFSTDCATGDNTCAASTVAPVAIGGLTHAWRRSDLSGTTDAFVSVLNPSGRGIGTLPGVPAAGTKVNPFCNSTDATSGTASVGGSADFSDNDPIRTTCGAAGAIDNVCGYSGKKQGDTTAGNNIGDLGVVLPILLPDSATALATDIYPPNVACTNACVLVAPIAGNQLPAGYRCVDGTLPVAGGCFMPAVNGDPRCVSGNHNKCAGASGNPDGRRYNLATVILATQIPQAQRGLYAYQFASDANSKQGNRRFLTGSFFRIHEYSAGLHNAPVTGTTGQCRENDDTSQIGCLVDSDPCSVGYAGREASKFFPGVGGTPVTSAATKLKALAVGGDVVVSGATVTVPLTPPYTVAGADENLAIEDLLNTTIDSSHPFYPLSRRLYVASEVGFGNLQGGEKQLARCYADNSHVNSIVQLHGFVPLNGLNGPGGVQCVDYPEDEQGATATTSPPANVRAALADTTQYLPGCNTGLTGHNSCLVSTEAPDICGDGVTTPDEGCDDGNTVSGDGCSSTCTVEAGFACVSDGTPAAKSVCTPTP